MVVQIRKPTAERRQEIVEAVLRIIGKRGMTSLTTRTLASEVGVTTGALFRHFTSLGEILREVAEHALLRIEETFPNESLPPLERLQLLARNRVELLRSDPGLAWVLRSEQAYLTFPEDSVLRLREVVQRSKCFLLDAIREGVAQGCIRKDIEPEILLVLVIGTIHVVAGMPGIHQLEEGARSPNSEEVFEALVRVLEFSAREKL